MSNWVRQWNVPGKGDKIYKVSQSYMGYFACSCPMWLHQRAAHSEREDCKHILKIKLDLERQENRRLGNRVFEGPEAVEPDNEILPKRRIIINEQGPAPQTNLDTDDNMIKDYTGVRGREHRGPSPLITPRRRRF